MPIIQSRWHRPCHMWITDSIGLIPRVRCHCNTFYCSENMKAVYCAIDRDWWSTGTNSILAIFSFLCATIRELDCHRHLGRLHRWHPTGPPLAIPSYLAVSVASLTWLLTMTSENYVVDSISVRSDEKQDVGGRFHSPRGLVPWIRLFRNERKPVSPDYCTYMPALAQIFVTQKTHVLAVENLQR